MQEPYQDFLRGVGLQVIARIKPRHGTQREDLKLTKNTITLLDINGFARYDAEVAQAFPSETINRDLYESQLQAFVPVALQGINLGVLSVGATGSGKTQSFEGTKAEAGIVSLFVEGLFAEIKEKAYSVTESYSCIVRMQFVEVLNEEVTNLLSHKGVGGALFKVSMDSWEGPNIEGAEKIQIESPKDFSSLYQIGLKNKNNSTDEFGKLSDRAGTVLILEIAQTLGEGPDAQLLISHVTFAELPSVEILEKDRELLKIEQGEDMNKGIFTFHDFLMANANGNLSGAKSLITGSELTKLCSELLGGNTLTIGIFNFQYNDQIGSGFTMKLLNAARKIVCYPIQNDNRAIGLLGKLREEIVLKGEGGRAIQYEKRIAELEKRLVGENMNQLSFVQEKKAIFGQFQELKEKYNEVLRQKGQAQSQLLKAEEEKLALSQSVVELQIENAKLQEQLHSTQIDQNAENMEERWDTTNLLEDRENAKKEIESLKDKLKMALEDNREIEAEFMTLKKNFLEKAQELESEKSKVEELNIRLLKGYDSETILKKKGPEHESQIKYTAKLEMDVANLKKKLETVTKDLDKARNDRAKMELSMAKMKLEFDSRVLHGEPTTKTDSSKELLEIKAKCKRLERELEESKDDLQDIIEQNTALETNNKIIEEELEEYTTNYREKLVDLAGERAENELINSLTEGEKRLKNKLKETTAKLAETRRKCAFFRKKATQLKGLCEDLLPKGKARPSILDEKEPLEECEEDSAAVSSRNSSDLENLRKGYEKLRVENEALKAKLEQVEENKGNGKQGMVQRRILEELKALKEGGVKKSLRPGTGEEDYEQIKKERTKLLEENRKLKIILEQDAAGPSSGGTIKQLKQRIMYLENAVHDLEKERSELKVRATMAEQQLKTLQGYYNKATQDYQRRLLEMKKKLGPTS